jgi:hypothetical protein
LLGAHGADQPPASGVSVIDLGTPVPPVRLVATTEPAAAVPASEAQDWEEVVSLEDLAEELEAEEAVPLALPGQDDDEPAQVADEAQVGDDARPQGMDDRAERVDDPAAPAGTEPEPPPDATGAGSLEALLRRRGLTALAHVEEVEVTERGARG